MKNIKLMPDYDCFPLWDMDGMENIDPNSVPISEHTKDRLIAWADHYDQTLNRDDPVSSGFASKEDEIAFEEEGKQLWRKLQEELASGYQVHYFSQLSSKVIE